jgi:hypothetical protein
VYSDTCHWRGTEKPTGTTASDFVTAVAAVETLNLLVLGDATVDGHPAKKVRIGVGDDFDLATCDNREARSYEGRRYRRRWSVEDLTVIDLENGDRVLVALGYPSGVKRHTYEALRYVVDSLRIAPITP